MIQNRRALRTDHIKMFVLDEADEMLSVFPHSRTSLTSSAVSKIKSTTSSNSFPLQPKPFSFPQQCHRMSLKSLKNSCATPFASSSKKTNSPSKVSNNSTLPSKKKIGNSILSPIYTKQSPLLKLLFSAIHVERSIG